LLHVIGVIGSNTAPKTVRRLGLLSSPFGLLIEPSGRQENVERLRLLFLGCFRVGINRSFVEVALGFTGDTIFGA